MKQFQTAYKGKEAFRQEAVRWNGQLRDSGTKGLIHIFAQYTGDEALRCELVSIARILDEEMPQVPYIGAAAAGPIFDGYVSEENIIIVCTEFEAEDTAAHVRVFRAEDADAADLAGAVSSFEESIPDLKGIEIIATSEQGCVMDICRTLNRVTAPEVKVFGGLAVSDNEHTSYVFAKGTGFCRDAFVLAALSGRELHISTDRVTGWKPIGASMKATRSEGSTLYELDGEPAYNVYYKYLRIPNDENIFYNALEFPFEVTDATGAKYLRHAKSCSSDGAIAMSTVVPQGSTVRITYGDPKTIVQSVEDECTKAREFQPQVIAVFDCFGRKLFWGESASKDTRPFYHVADTYGFCTLGEIMRKDGEVTLHNLSVIVACMREGEKTAPRHEDKFRDRNKEVMSLVSRLANFIDAATGDLMVANEQLQIMSVTDQLTGLLNRGEIQRRIDEAIRRAKAERTKLSLIMGDIDDFKHINDTYGHAEGDEVLRGVSRAILEVSRSGKNIAAGRWGGEEFMLVLPGVNAAGAAETAEELRSRIEALHFEDAGQVTMSFGVTELRDEDQDDAAAIRVDRAMYGSKHAGKNRVTVL